MSAVPKSSPAASELDEVTLVRACRGDAGARRTLIVRYEGQVHAFVARMLVSRRHRSLCQDLTHDTFVRVLHALPGFDPKGPAKLSTWILTIASRLCIDELRRRECPVDVNTLLETDAGAAHSPLVLTERRRVAAAIEAAIGELPVGFRAAFLLREAHGLSYEEIAQALDIELGSVRSRLARARARLQIALAEHNPGLTRRSVPASEEES
jgi:RNA polymerase sigma-70 factor (ECF subfamily)